MLKTNSEVRVRIAVKAMFFYTDANYPRVLFIAITGILFTTAAKNILHPAAIYIKL